MVSGHTQFRDSSSGRTQRIASMASGSRGHTRFVMTRSQVPHLDHSWPGQTCIAPRHMAESQSTIHRDQFTRTRFPQLTKAVTAPIPRF